MEYDNRVTRMLYMYTSVLSALISLMQHHPEQMEVEQAQKGKPQKVKQAHPRKTQVSIDMYGCHDACLTCVPSYNLHVHMYNSGNI